MQEWGMQVNYFLLFDASIILSIAKKVKIKIIFVSQIIALIWKGNEISLVIDYLTLTFLLEKSSLKTPICVFVYQKLARLFRVLLPRWLPHGRRLLRGCGRVFFGQRRLPPPLY